MDTLTKLCSPTIVITANGEVQTHEEAIVYVKELDMFLTMKVLEHASSIIARKALQLKRVLLRMDQWSKTTSHWKTASGWHRSDHGSWFLNEFFSSFLSVISMTLSRQELDHSKARLLPLPQLCQATVRRKKRWIRVGQIHIQWLCHVNTLKEENGSARWHSQPKKPKPNKTKTTI